MTTKPKVAFYWCASCGGCEEAIVDLHEAILDVVAAVDIVFWPVALDFKLDDVNAMEDGSIAVSFINGAIRTDEQEHVAKILRKKSGAVIAFGSCAHLGGIPGLANLTSRKAIFERSYLSSPTVVNKEQKVPQVTSMVDGVEATLPAFWEQVHTLDQVVDVDYYLPGCPPMPQTISDAVGAILSGKLPPKGTVLSSNKSLCDTCERRDTKDPNAVIERVYRPHEIEADPNVCFIDQGIVCMGPATRGGCGEMCIDGNMPCTGCYGPTSEVSDQGAAMLSAFSSMLSGKTKEDTKEQATKIVDPAGTFNRYGIPASLLHNRLEKEGK